MTSEPETVWDHMECIERPAPSAEEIDAVELAVARQLSGLGGMQGIASAIDIVAALIYAEDFVTGTPAFARYMKILNKFIVRRVRQLEKTDALVPADIRESCLQ